MLNNTIPLMIHCIYEVTCKPNSKYYSKRSTDESVKRGTAGQNANNLGRTVKVYTVYRSRHDA